MITEKQNTRLSKFLSYLLRHNPAELDIVLDSNGWTSTDELIKKIQTKEPQFSFAVLEHIVNTNNKKRFSFNDDKSMIRASQGHSVTVDLNYAPAQPPEFLFHGTAEKNSDSILKIGLLKMDRHHVHLSSSIDTALKVGQRHGKPMVFKISSGLMYEKGYLFFLSDNDVWLTESVPAEFIQRISKN